MSNKKRALIIAVIAVLCLSKSTGVVFASPDTTVSYSVTADHLFSLAEVDASVTLNCSAVFSPSVGTVLPNSSIVYSLAANPEL